MRRFVIILLLTVPLTSFQTSESFRVTGNIYRCQNNESEFFGRGLWICKNNDCKDVQVFSGGRFTILGLTKGTYEIRYDNIWRQTLSDVIEIKENLSGYKICVDKFKERENYPLLELFKKSNKIEIKQSSTGCFHSTEKFIKLEKKNDKYYGTLTTDKGVKSVLAPYKLHRNFI